MPIPLSFGHGSQETRTIGQTVFFLGSWTGTFARDWVAMLKISQVGVQLRKFSTSSVWEAGKKAREAARALAALPNEDRNAALERVAAALESGKASFFVPIVRSRRSIEHIVYTGSHRGCK